MSASPLTRTGDFVQDTGLYDRSVTSTNVLLDLWPLWLAIVLGFVVFYWIRNRSRFLSRLEQRCSAAVADVDAILAERHALIPNLVEIARSHTNFELTVLDRLIEAQRDALKAMGEYRLTAETELGNAINQFVSAASQMPDMRSGEEFKHLRQELVRVEEKVTAARRYYNMTVEEYRAITNSFPVNLMFWIKRESFEKFSLGERRAELAEPIAISLS